MLINWVALIQLLIPQWLRKSRLISYLMVLTQPVRWLHAQYVTYRTNSLYDLGITAQVISLERMLNDRWDYINRGIYIENVADASQLYVYNKIEAKPPLYLYNKWTGTHHYLPGEFAIYSGKVWTSVVNTPLLPPSDSNTAEWTYYKDFDTYLHNPGEGVVPYDFIIHFPVDVSFDLSELAAKMATKKLAGKKYITETP